MRHTTTSPRTGVPAAWLASAANHLKNGWKVGSDPAPGGLYTAAPSFPAVVHHAWSRPRTVTLRAFGAGVALGLLTGVLVSNLGRAASR